VAAARRLAITRTPWNTTASRKNGVQQMMKKSAML
jgi:hypothetical protein